MILSLLVPAAFAISATVSPGDDVGAVLASLGPGDVITFNNGLYELEGTLRVTEAMGEEGNPVRLAAATGATPVLKAGDFSVLEVRDSDHVVIEGLVLEGPEDWMETGGAGLVIADSDHVQVLGNEIRNLRSDLLRIVGDTTGLVIRDNHLHDTWVGTGIYVGCGDGRCWMSESTLEHNLLHHVGNPDDQRSGIILDNGCQANTLRDNVIFEITGVGLRVESTQLGDANVVEGNAIWNTGSHGMEVVGEALVRNNVVVQAQGIGIRSGNHENNDLRNVRITFNTVALAGQEAVRLDDWANREGMVFSSNAIANITGRGFRYDSDEEDTTNYITSNVVSGLVEGVDPTLFPDWYLPGSGLADFADAVNWDFYPAVNSGLVGVGDPASEAWVPSVDFNGDPRNGASPTVGAFQWSGAGNPGWILAEDFKNTEPTVRIVDGSGGGCCKKNQDGSEAVLLLPLLGLFAGRRRRG
ncbi:MAG: right-handed parallel beta-helix repeat-containing protein [Alphaproteobacteria bacterium]|nr:right-handed parallel beta-helix repeat-containing protein [Alphaproteobacteria bacterium]